MPPVRQGQIPREDLHHPVPNSKSLVRRHWWGSSNFTRPGLTENIELNVQIQSAREVAQLQDWFEEYWNEAKEASDALIETIERHTRLYSPFEVYAKALQEFFRGHELTATEWDETRSRMFPPTRPLPTGSLLGSHEDWAAAWWSVPLRWGGSRKTFVGLMLIERLVLHEGKRVVLFAPKAAKEGVWEPHLREWLPHIGGGAADFSNLAVFSHTDLHRKGDFPERFQRIAELADVVIIDEAHHLGTQAREEVTTAGSRLATTGCTISWMTPCVPRQCSCLRRRRSTTG